MSDGRWTELYPDFERRMTDDWVENCIRAHRFFDNHATPLDVTYDPSSILMNAVWRKIVYDGEKLQVERVRTKNGFIYDFLAFKKDESLYSLGYILQYVPEEWRDLYDDP